MEYGICPLSVVAIRSSADESAELVSQIVYGEHFKILEQRKFYSRIRLAFDGLEGWVQKNQIHFIEQDIYKAIDHVKNPEYVSDLVSFVTTEDAVLIPIIMGSSVHNLIALSNIFEGTSINIKKEKSNLINTALLFLNSPELKGGRTPFGLDCSGFSQMVYKINGHSLKRNALQQASQGEALSFVEESEPGDLAFFDDMEGVINHVGIIMKDNYIIHVHGKVRIDRIDHTGIFNSEIRNYTHTLRVIKKVI